MSYCTIAEPVSTDELNRLQKGLLEQAAGRTILLTRLYERVLLQIKCTLSHETVPKFWARFTPSIRQAGDQTSLGLPKHLGVAVATEINGRLLEFQNAVKELYLQYAFFRRQLKRLALVCSDTIVPYHVRKKSNEVAEFHDMFHCELLSQLPPHFNDLVYDFYTIAFRVFVFTYAENEDYMEIPESHHCEACGVENNECQCQTIASAFNITNKYLSLMGLLDQIAGYTLNQLIQERIDAKVRETKENYATSHVESLELWLNTVVLQWLTRIYNQGSLQVKPEHHSVQKAIDNFQLKLSFYMYENYANTIVNQFFQIIINFPMSQPAVDDLKLCLGKIKLKRCFVETIRQMLQNRLLHPGVDTPDILTGYVAALKTLAHFDTSGVLLRSITKPVKEYLRGRPETVRCVVTSLTGEGTSDLAEELAKSDPNETKAPNENPEETDWKNWNPDPANVAPAMLKSASASKAADIISMVVDIYGSKEIFVNEYRNLLAERLLSQMDFNPEREVKNLELLKLRFGESMLHSCEVMLKDITDSKRINNHILLPDSESDKNIPFPLSALIVSSQFWPTFKKETMELPSAIKEIFDMYTKAYEAYKVNRTLHWTPLNGKVCIEVEHNGKVQEMLVTPAQAAIIIHFSEQSQWELDALGQVLNMPPIVLRKRLLFWQSNGLIRETKENVFVLVDKNDDSEKSLEQMQGQSNDMCEEEEAESAMESASDQREEELQVFWSYIEAMLTNLDSLPLDRIHQMLKMFASQVDFTQDELKNILQRKVREHKLVYAGGVYQLPKS
ncbi:anaphase-promoting complex subunit 2 [Anopheles cruzii]|uniref:anaphase-promoting complex subunit 2 n=1 Tax=Anopheles cruzii TaxID=68878 RepID=UPI0022EC3A75|nr:anaphase-promoting complex subunit 2 [Anopheles cruzii]